MSELTLTVIKLGFLAVLWLFVFSVASAMRGDLFGVRPAKAPEAATVRPQPPRQPRPARGAPSTLAIVDGPDKGRTVSLAGPSITVGRGTDCSLALSDEYTSTRHARFVQHEGQWYVEDLGSTNGTYIGHERIQRATPVMTKTRVRVGKTVIELRK